MNQGDKIEFKGLRQLVEAGATEIPLKVDGREIVTLLEVSERERQELLAGGTLNYVKKGIV